MCDSLFGPLTLVVPLAGAGASPSGRSYRAVESSQLSEGLSGGRAMCATPDTLQDRPLDVKGPIFWL